MRSFRLVRSPGRVGVLLAGAVCSLGLGGLVPASAGPSPVPPACNPLVSGAGMPGCPSVLVGEVGDIENPAYALPDLVPDTTEVYVDHEWIELRNGHWVFGPGLLNFDTHARNEGLVPLELSADDLSVEGSAVSQCVSWTTDFVCRERRSVGGFHWHQEHLHYHFEEFAAYELRRLKDDGQPDFSKDGLLTTSPKVSFCLIDSTKIRGDARPVPRYNTCNPAEEGISPGYADVYASGIPGQMLSLEGLTDGRYALVISMNGSSRIMETNSANNRVIAIVEITGLNSFAATASIMDKWHV